MAETSSALNRITPEVVARAAALVKVGKVYDLGAELSDDMPATSNDVFMPYRLLTYRSLAISSVSSALMALPSIPKL